jgi:hypothetical protein
MALARLREHVIIEVGQRHDQPYLVKLNEVAKRIDLERVVDAWDDRGAVSVVERGRQLIDVGSDGRRADLAKRGDDVDALTRAREQDGRHDYGG